MENEYSFKQMFEDRIIRILVDNLEAIIAKKFKTVITRSVKNIWSRDF